MLTLREVTRTYGDRVVLDRVSLEVARGQRVALIGPSGGGKSTVLRLCAGLIQPDRGTVAVDGVPVLGAGMAAARRRLGYVIQEGGLFPHLDGHANVALGARQQGWPADRVRARIAELAELVRLSPALLDRYPAQLSGGQRQRVALMRALVGDPDLLLLDEPLGALDPMVRAELQDDLRALFARLGRTVLLVTHDLAEAAHLADTVVLLHEGRVVQQGPIAELAERPASDFVRQFVRAQRGLHLPADDAGG